MNTRRRKRVLRLDKDKQYPVDIGSKLYKRLYHNPSNVCIYFLFSTGFLIKQLKKKGKK